VRDADPRDVGRDRLRAEPLFVEHPPDPALERLRLCRQGDKVALRAVALHVAQPVVVDEPGPFPDRVGLEEVPLGADDVAPGLPDPAVLDHDLPVLSWRF
jgi:hypothetical protein